MASTVTAATATKQLLLRRDADGVTTLTLNRPQQFNALSGALLNELQAALAGIAGNQSVRVVVIAGAGPAFCPGHDLKEMRANRNPGFIEDLFRRCSRVMMTLTEIPQPVIARVHGIATAAGCQLVAACDLAVASTEARFATSGVNFGLFCSTPGVALSRNMPRKQAMEMLLTGEMISAARALEIGLINRAVPTEELDSAVATLAGVIAGKSPKTLAIGKEAFYRQADMGLAEAYAYASEVMTQNMMARDAAEGIDAFIEKRHPTWQGR